MSISRRLFNLARAELKGAVENLAHPIEAMKEKKKVRGEVEELLEAAAETEGIVRVRGFMTLAPLVEEAEDVRYVFAKLRAIRDRLRESWSTRFDLSELSMGMSGDYEVAVEEGATMVRIGRMLIEDGPVRRQDGS